MRSHEKCPLRVGAAAFCLRHNDIHSACDEKRTRWSVQNTAIGNRAVAAAAVRAGTVSPVSSTSRLAAPGQFGS